MRVHALFGSWYNGKMRDFRFSSVLPAISRSAHSRSYVNELYQRESLGCEARHRVAMQYRTSSVFPAYIAQVDTIALPSSVSSVVKPDIVDVIGNVEGTPTAGPEGTE